jgi:FAD/FMN-containing dehydrogenase
MKHPIYSRLSAVLGVDACELLAGDRIRVSPPTTESCAALLGLCYDANWQLSIEGRATWQPDDAPTQVVVSLRALDQLLEVRAAELCIAAHAGAAMALLRREALEAGCWLPLDPPGHPGRSAGSVIATGTIGPLHQSLGSMHNQLLGLTVVTGDGHILRSVNEPHAGAVDPEDIGMHVGGFGGFGIITECRLRLHLLPRADATWVAIADRDRLTAAGRMLADRQVGAAAVELMSPALANEREWLLAVRFLGDREAVDLGGRRLAEVPGLSWRELGADQQQLLWNGSARAMTSLPVTFRLSGLVEGLDDTLDLVVARLGESLLSAGAADGTLRWCGHVEARTLRLLRATLAAREIPLTVERAPWPLLRAVGHFGAYREGGIGLVSRLRERFDPRGVLLSALGSEDGE